MLLNIEVLRKHIEVPFKETEFEFRQNPVARAIKERFRLFSAQAFPMRWGTLVAMNDNGFGRVPQLVPVFDQRVFDTVVGLKHDPFVFVLDFSLAWPADPFLHV